EVSGNNIDVSVLFVHAQDHLMTSIEAKSLIECMIKMYKRIENLEKGK
ncbi:MAG: PTS lactose/cellobiose transporter subunit IIA, partial [Leptotrichiaceae bacterium]|nr:PTS lactose/cellobiose transporter subunit IIA [Leptotrichiaceae bacterium]